MTQFIPLQQGQRLLLKGQPLISGLLEQVGYEPTGDTILFTEDITINNINFVDMKLVVLDIDSYDDFTPLPIPANFEAKIVEEVYQSFLPQIAMPPQPQLKTQEMPQ